jgi:hypothetical protein
VKATGLFETLSRIEEMANQGDAAAASAAKLVGEARREYDAVESFLDPNRRPALAH